VRKTDIYSYLSLIFSVFLKLILISLLLISVLTQNWLWVLFGSIMTIISFIPLFLKIFYKMHIPWVIDFLITIALIFHIGDGVFFVSNFLPIYNKFTHFFSSAVVGSILLVSLYVIDECSDEINFSTFRLLLDVLVVTISFGVLWEFMEWTSDTFFGFNTQLGLQDTMMDLLSDSLGALLIVLFGYYLVKESKLKNMTKDIRKKFNLYFCDK